MPDLPAHDAGLQTRVMAAVAAALGEAAPTVGVAVDHGAVLLAGEVRSVSMRASAVSAAQAVPGVSTVRDALSVLPASAILRTDDTDVTRGVQVAIDWATSAPDSVRAEIRTSAVILTGAVRSDIERRAVAHTVGLVPGVERVDDRIRVSRPETRAS